MVTDCEKLVYLSIANVESANSSNCVDHMVQFLSGRGRLITIRSGQLAEEIPIWYPDSLERSKIVT